jgi:hypothetical protein
MSEEISVVAPNRTLRNIIARGDPLDPWQRAAIGKSAQLRLPLTDKVDLRRLAVILRDLANVLEVASGTKHDDDFASLMRAKAAVVIAQGKARRERR